MSIRDLKKSDKPLIWSDLKEVISNLNEEQLKQPVVFWGEGVGGKFGAVNELLEDYINPSGEGCEPVSVYKDEPEYLENEPIVFEKGSLILEVLEK